VKDLVDNTGEVVNHLIYDSYGNVVSESNAAVDTRYLFTGREWDEEIELYYYRARYYDPEIGRFILEDPIGFEAGDTNLYRYVENSPLDTVDPLGLRGLVLAQTRMIFYDDNGRTFTNNIQDVIEAYQRNPDVSINFDNTLAFITYFPVRTGTDADRRIIPPGFRPGFDNRGHIVAGRLLGGDGGDINNLFAQNSFINQQVWKPYEEQVESYLNNRNLDPSCPPVNLVYSVNLSYTTIPFFHHLRPITVTGLAIFSDGNVIPGTVLNP